jgi:hypothetical protein
MLEELASLSWAVFPSVPSISSTPRKPTTDSAARLAAALCGHRNEDDFITLKRQMRPERVVKKTLGSSNEPPRRRPQSEVVSFAPKTLVSSSLESACVVGRVSSIDSTCIIPIATVNTKSDATVPVNTSSVMFHEPLSQPSPIYELVICTPNDDATIEGELNPASPSSHELKAVVQNRKQRRKIRRLRIPETAEKETTCISSSTCSVPATSSTPTSGAELQKHRRHKKRRRGSIKAPCCGAIES